MNLMEKEKNEMESVTVARGSTHLVPFQVEKPGSILKLEKTCLLYSGTPLIWIYTCGTEESACAY